MTVKITGIKEAIRALSAAPNIVANTFMIAFDQEVTRRTPVDTGHARSNWLPSVDRQRNDIIPQPENAARESISRPANEDPVNVYPDPTKITRGTPKLFLTNNVEYIEDLNKGSSSQAPAMFVELSVKRAAERTPRLVAQKFGNL